MSDSSASEEEDRPTSILSSISALPVGFTAGDLPRLESLAALLAEFLLCLYATKDHQSPLIGGRYRLPFLTFCWSVGIARVAFLCTMPWAGTPYSGPQVSKQRVSKLCGQYPVILAPYWAGYWESSSPLCRGPPTHTNRVPKPQVRGSRAQPPKLRRGSTFSSTFRKRIVMWRETGVDPLASSHHLGGVVLGRLRAVCQLATEFCENRFSNFCVILLTNKQTNKQTQMKHNYLDR